MNKQQLANKIQESANKMRSKIEANENGHHKYQKSQLGGRKIANDAAIAGSLGSFYSNMQEKKALHSSTQIETVLKT